MNALVRGDDVRVVSVTRPRCEPRDALVVVGLAGVCSTDLEVMRGYNDFRGSMGHEMVGQVVECRSDPAWVGRRVVAEITVSCGTCDLCGSGLRGHCRSRSVIGIAGRSGCFAELIAVPVDNLHTVPDAVDDDAAVFTEPLAAAYQVATQVCVEARSIAVLGDGKLGLLVAMALGDRGGDVVVIGRHAHKLAIATAAGARTLAEGDAEPGSYEVVVEATGSRAGLAAALRLVRARGVLVLKSTFGSPPTFDTTRVVVDEIQVLGSRCGPFADALAALASGRVDPRPLIEARYPLDRGVEALRHAATKGALKILIHPTGDQ